MPKRPLAPQSSSGQSSATAPAQQRSGEEEPGGLQQQQDQQQSRQPRRKKISSACTHCRLRRKRCDGNIPCGNCQKGGLECHIDRSTDRRRQRIRQDGQSALQLMTLLRDADEATSARMLTLLRQDVSLDDIISVCAPVQDAESQSPVEGTMTLPEAKIRASPDTFKENAWGLAVLQLEIIESSIKYLCDAINTILFVTPADMIRQTFPQVRASNGPAVGGSLRCQISCMAAAGSVYSHGRIPESMGKMYHSLARELLAETIDSDPVAGLQCCVLLCVYASLVKSTIACMYIDIGLSIIDSKMPTALNDPVGSPQWRTTKRMKLWQRTLLTIRGCLVGTLGLVASTPSFDPAGISQSEDLDIAVSEEEDLDGLTAVREGVHRENARVSRFYAEALRGFLESDEMFLQRLGNIRAELREWVSSLPARLGLEKALDRQGHDWPNRGRICYVHLFCSNIVVMLYRRSMAFEGLSDCITSATPKQLPEQLQLMLQDGIQAARMTARIFEVAFDEETTVFTLCWLDIFQTYSSCLVLMLDVCRRAHQGKWDKSQISDMALAEGLIIRMRNSAKQDRVAKNFAAQLDPMFAKLQRASQRDNAASEVSAIWEEIHDALRAKFPAMGDSGGPMLESPAEAWGVMNDTSLGEEIDWMSLSGPVYNASDGRRLSQQVMIEVSRRWSRSRSVGSPCPWGWHMTV